MIKLNTIIDNIKKIENIKQDKEVCSLLDIRTDSLSKYKKKNTIPYDKIINYCIKRNLSIDDFLDINHNSIIYKFKHTSSSIDIDFLNLNEKLSIPEQYLPFPYKKSIYAFNENNDIYLVDIEIKEYSKSSLYLISTDNGLVLTQMKKNFKNELIVEALNKNIQVSSYKIEGKVLAKLNIDNI